MLSIILDSILCLFHRVSLEAVHPCTASRRFRRASCAPWWHRVRAYRCYKLNAAHLMQLGHIQAYEPYFHKN